MPDIKEITSLLQNPTEADLALIQRAYDFSRQAHSGQKRLSGEEYFDHVFATGKNLAELGMSATTIAAGLLHDTLEDTIVTAEDLEKNFGKEILFLVEGVTKLGKIKYHGATRHSESLRKLFIAMSQDIRVLIIKLCDRLHNMETLEFVPKEKQVRIAKETLEIYAPLAYRLGIRKLQRSLEDIAFAYVYPKEYEEVTKLLKLKLYESEESLQKFQKSLKKELALNDIIDFKTDYRVKGLYSLYKKLKRNEMDIEKIYDISAVRVMVKTVEECYKILGIVHQNWKPLPGRIKDYISTPKPNGYQSLHTTIFSGDGNIIEVQIRTEEMNKEAEYGIASHIFYKQIKDEKIKNSPKWIKELVEYQKKADDNEFLENIKTDFFEERIFVFTPKGDVIDLPAGSSALDFAYTIHSDIGNHASGVKINGKFVALGTTLQSSDIVQIDIKKTAKPSYKWLEFCKTTIAKRHIRNFLEMKK